MMLHLNEKLLFFYCPIDDNTDAIQMLHVVYRHTKNISIVYNICLSRRVDKEGTIKEQVMPLGLFSLGKRRLREDLIIVSKFSW